MTINSTLTITTTDIAQAATLRPPRGGRPRKGDDRARGQTTSYSVTQEAKGALVEAARLLGVTESAIIEALGRSIKAQLLSA